MPEQTFTFQEIENRIAELYKTTSAAFVKILSGHHDNKDSNESPYKKMSFEELLDIQTKFSRFIDGIPDDSFSFNLLAKYEELVKDFNHINESNLSTEQWKSLGKLKKDLDYIKTYYKRAEEELKKINEYFDSKFENVIQSGNISKLPRKINSNVRNAILVSLKKKSVNASKENLKKYASLLLQMYYVVPDNQKETYINELKALNGNLYTKLFGAIQIELKTIFKEFPRMFTPQDQKLLTEQLAEKSFFAKLFRRARAKLEQKNNINHTLSDGISHSR